MMTLPTQPVLNLPQVLAQQHSKTQLARKQRALQQWAKTQRISERGHIYARKKLLALVEEARQEALKALEASVIKTDAALNDKEKTYDLAKFLGGIEKLKQKARNATKQKELNAVASGALKQAQDTAAHQSQMLKVVFGQDVEQYLAGNPAIHSAMNLALQSNLQLIQNKQGIVEQFASQLQEDIHNAVVQGQRSSDLAKIIQERAGVAASRAKLIARDQTSKMIGAMNQARQEALGVGGYIWSTSKDERVRDSHAALEGQKFGWKEQTPIGYKPGEDINCRCVAVPDFVGLVRASQGAEAVVVTPEKVDTMESEAQRLEIQNVTSQKAEAKQVGEIESLDELKEALNSDEIAYSVQSRYIEKKEEGYWNKMPELSEIRAKAVIAYTSSFHANINMPLLAGEELQRPVARVANSISEGLKYFPTMEDEGRAVVNRGISVSSEIADSIVQRYKDALGNGTVVTEPIFLSTSFDPQSDFLKGANIIFYVEGASGRVIDKVSLFPNECEVLFDRSTSFKVKSVELDERGRWEIELEEAQ